MGNGLECLCEHKRIHLVLKCEVSHIGHRGKAAVHARVLLQVVHNVLANLQHRGW